MRAVFFVVTTVAFGIMGMVAAYIEGQGWSLLGCGLAGIALGAFIGNWASPDSGSLNPRRAAA